MSSRLIRRTEASHAEPVQWSQLGKHEDQERPYQYQRSPAASRTPAQDQIEHFKQRVAELEAEVKQRAAEAREIGHCEGEKAARANAQAEVEGVLQKLAESAQQIATLRPRLRLETEADMVRLAVAIARRIVYRELQTDESAITGVVRIAFEKLRLQEIVRVVAHPDHHKTLQHLLGRAGGVEVEVVADPALLRGNVIFETSRGNLDVSAETQLREIERGLTDRLRSAGV